MTADASKNTLPFICEILQSFGLAREGVASPEALRAAKNNDLQSVPNLWRGLHELILIRLNNFADVNKQLLSQIWKDITQQQQEDRVVEMVFYYMGCWGYTRQQFYEMNFEEAHSRELLIAFGWLLAHCEIFEKFDAKFVESRDSKKPPSPLPPYPVHTYTLPETEISVQNERTQVKQVLQQISASKGHVDTRVLINQIQQLYGRLQHVVKGVDQWEKQYLSIQHHLQQLQQESKPATTYTLYELYLLRNPKSLSQHQQALLYYNETQRERELHTSHFDKFWKWLASALADTDGQRTESEASQLPEEVQLPSLPELLEQAELLLRELTEELSRRQGEFASIESLWNAQLQSRDFFLHSHLFNEVAIEQKVRDFFPHPSAAHFRLAALCSAKPGSSPTAALPSTPLAEQTLLDLPLLALSKSDRQERVTHPLSQSPYLPATQRSKVPSSLPPPSISVAEIELQRLKNVENVFENLLTQQRRGCLSELSEIIGPTLEQEEYKTVGMAEMLSLD